MHAVTMMKIKQLQDAEHCNASKHIQPTTNKHTCLQARTTRFPGKQLDSKKQRHEEASVEPRHVHATIANPTSTSDIHGDEERTRACGLPAPASASLSGQWRAAEETIGGQASKDGESARELCADA